MQATATRNGKPPKPKRAEEPDIDYQRLCTAMRRSRISTRQYREERLMAVKQYVGTHWSEEAVRETVPLNLVSIYSKIVLRKLVSHNPRVMLSTFDKDMKPAVGAMEEWVNAELKKMGFAALLKEVALDALFSIGIVKVALATPADSSQYHWNVPAGNPFVERVDFDDFVFDIHAQSWKECSYIGHRLRVPLEAVKNSKLYSERRHSLSAAPQRLFNQEGDERINTFGRTSLSGGDSQEFLDHVDLWEIYLPYYRKIVTLADDDLTAPSGIPLRVQEWIGPDCGPYHILAVDIVPGNIMPIGPIMQLIDLHASTNNCLRKLIRQCQRQKEITLVTAVGAEDGDRVIRCNDGEVITVTDPSAISRIVCGGPSQELFALMQAMQQMFSWAAGNLDTMGGLSPQAKTASQEQLLNSNSSGSVADMQEIVVNYVAKIEESLMWYWWQHPTQTFNITHHLPQMPSISLRRSVTPDQRAKMPFQNLDISIDPYSLQHSSPQATMQQITQIVETIIVPMQPLLQAQGIFFDINNFLAKMAKYNNIPDLADIVSIIEPPSAEGQGNPNGGGGGQGPAQLSPGKPQNTTREYVRHSTPGRTNQGDMKDLTNRLLGKDTGGNPNAERNGQWK